MVITACVTVCASVSLCSLGSGREGQALLPPEAARAEQHLLAEKEAACPGGGKGLPLL